MELPFAGVIIAVIASVMLPEFSRMYAAGTAKEEYILLWNRTVFQSASLIYPISIFCFIFAEDIITCLYGPKYGIASDLFRIITIINRYRHDKVVPVDINAMPVTDGKKLTQAMSRPTTRTAVNK